MARYQNQQLWVDKQQLNTTKWYSQTIDTTELGENEVLLATKAFGFSANNITYAALGHGMGYWGFFPADEQHGIVPVWGFAEVVASNCEGVEVGKRVFGYLPMAEYWIIQPTKLSDFGFYDAHPKRRSISPVYDNYLYCDRDPAYQADREVWQLNFRPLFMTSFVLAEYVFDHPEYQTIYITSASSKTAFGTAHQLRQNPRNANLKIVGITSVRNLDFVRDINCYDHVMSYDEIDTIAKQANSWLLDFAAKGDIINRLAPHVGKITLIGATDWAATEKVNPKALGAEIFFAPDQVRLKTKTWGQGEFLHRYSQVWQAFATDIAPFVSEVQYSGITASEALYQDTLSGKADTRALNQVTLD